MLKEHWPQAGQIEKKSLLLTANDLNAVNFRSKLHSKDRVYRYYEVKKEESVLGYGLIISQIVRTKTMAVLYVINPQGDIAKIEVLAFWEPPEYAPKVSWLSQFSGKTKSSSLRLKQDITNITGATLSARAVTQKARLARQIVLLKLKRSMKF